MVILWQTAAAAACAGHLQGCAGPPTADSFVNTPRGLKDSKYMSQQATGKDAGATTFPGLRGHERGPKKNMRRPPMRPLLAPNKKQLLPSPGPLGFQLVGG